MNLVIYDSIHHSIEEIIAHVTRPPFDFIKSDVTKELYKLYNGGWISDTQLFVVQSRLGIEAAPQVAKSLSNLQHRYFIPPT